jgi:predicted aspartyl protease
MSQRVVSSRFPYLPVHLDVDGHSEDVEALLDTGFDGDVAVPPSMVPGGQPPDYLETWTLADGTQLVIPTFLGSAQIGGLPAFPVTLTALGDEPLVGRGVGDRFRITLDHGQQVILEP